MKINWTWAIIGLVVGVAGTFAVSYFMTKKAEEGGEQKK